MPASANQKKRHARAPSLSDARVSDHADTTMSFGGTANPDQGATSQLISIGSGAIALSVMIHRGDISDMESLVILNSVDYPMPPSQEFCDQMWEAGLQVIFIERPGFGSTRGLPKAILQDAQIKNGVSVTAEAALIHQLLSQLELSDIILLGMGSANPVCYRLAKLNQNISLAVFSNAMFNQDIWDVFRPAWFKHMLRQTVESKAGLHFATYGIKYKLRKEPFSFYRQLLQKSPGDMRYFEEHRADFLAASQMIRNIEPATFNYDLRMSLAHDELLHDGFFDGVNALIISGTETTDLWKEQSEMEAARLSIPVEYLPHGDLYAPYASPHQFLQVLRDHSGLQRRAAAG